MAAVKFETVVDESVAKALPSLRPLLGKKVRVVASTHVPPKPRVENTLAEFLKHRLKRPDHIEPVSLEGIEEAIARGAQGGDFRY